MLLGATLFTTKPQLGEFFVNLAGSIFGTHPGMEKRGIFQWKVQG